MDLRSLRARALVVPGVLLGGVTSAQSLKIKCRRLVGEPHVPRPPILRHQVLEEQLDVARDAAALPQRKLSPPHCELRFAGPELALDAVDRHQSPAVSLTASTCSL